MFSVGAAVSNSFPTRSGARERTDALRSPVPAPAAASSPRRVFQGLPSIGEQDVDAAGSGVTMSGGPRGHFLQWVENADSLAVFRSGLRAGFERPRGLH